MAHIYYYDKRRIYPRFFFGNFYKMLRKMVFFRKMVEAFFDVKVVSLNCFL